MTDTTINTAPKPIDLFDIFDTNRESEENGIWVDLNEVTKFKIRAFNAKVVVDLRDTLTKPFQTLVRAGMSIPDDKNEEIGLKVIAGAILADWKGVVIGGEELPYTTENAYGLLKKLPKFANFIAQFAMNTQNYRDALREEAVKN